MGLLRAGIGALTGVLSDQWRDYFASEALPPEVLATKARKRVTRRFGGSRYEDDNVISDGSIIAVNEGQCMIIVESGKIVDLCAEPGEYVYDLSTEPSLFYGPLDLDKLKAVLDATFRRFQFGGQAGKDQRVYFINTREIPGNKYGTPNPVPFRVVDANVGLDVDISIRCFGEYAYRIVNPMLFYVNVCGNVEVEYTRDQIDSQLKSELMTALQPAFARISEMGIRYSALPGHTMELAQALNDVLSEKWSKLRGIEIVSFGVSSVTASAEDERMIKELQRNATFRNPTMAAAHLAGAQAQAMQDAARNAGGAFVGFAGMQAAQGVGGLNPQALYAMGQAQPAAPAASGWKCACGATNTGKFCSECGKPKPSDEGWICTQCGTRNKGRFCSECGARKPAGAPVYRCDKCGWEPEDKSNPPRFCPECGDPFTDDDRA